MPKSSKRKRKGKKKINHKARKRIYENKLEYKKISSQLKKPRGSEFQDYMLDSNPLMFNWLIEKHK